MVFGADIIAGFPTETEEMFENTLTIVDEADLTYLHVFPYSPRPGTPAARMPQVDAGRCARRGRAAARRWRRSSSQRFAQRGMGAIENRCWSSATAGPDRAVRADRRAGLAAPGEIVPVRVTGASADRPRSAKPEDGGLMAEKKPGLFSTGCSGAKQPPPIPSRFRR